MRLINRAAITVRPKQPYIDWANAFDDEGPRLDLNALPDDRTVYLVEDIEYYEGDVEGIIRRYFRTIFTHELNAWHLIESDWPQKRDLATFMAWFEVEVHSMLLDLEQTSIEAESYEEY